MSRARLAGHALHPILVVFPLGLLTTSFVWDVVHLATGRQVMWAQIAFWTIFAGVIGGLLTAMPGLVDWLGVPRGTRARRVGLLHGLLNVAVVALFVVNLVMRWMAGYSQPPVAAMVIGWVALGMAGVAGWLGGELVERMGIGVYPDAHPNAPSSLETTVPAASVRLRGPRERAPEEAERRPPIGPTEPQPVG